MHLYVKCYCVRNIGPMCGIKRQVKVDIGLSIHVWVFGGYLGTWGFVVIVILLPYLVALYSHALARLSPT